MKKVFISIILLILIVVMSSCSKDVVTTTANGATVINGVVQKKPIAEPNLDIDRDRKEYFRGRIIGIAENKINLELTHSESMNNLFYQYTIDDFPEVELEKIEERETVWTQDVLNYVSGSDEPPTSNIFKFGLLDSFTRGFTLYLKNPSVENVMEGVHKLEERIDVRYVSPFCPMIWFSTTTNDPNLSRQNQLSLINIYDAWDYTTGSSNVKIGVVDGGIMAFHEDLVDNVDSSLSYAFGNNFSPFINLRETHGTQMAGIIGAKGNNGIGISGVCQNISLVSLRVDNEYGLEDYTIVDDAINYAAQHNIPILNLSFGSENNYYDIYNAIQNYPGLVICAIGNNNLNTDVNPIYPACYDLPNIISVGGSNNSNQKHVDSNYGALSVDLFAPRSAYTTNANLTNPYGACVGTSASAAYVTGVVGLLLSYWPTLTTAQLKASILNNVSVYAGLSSYCVTGGVLNAYEAIENMVHTHNYVGNCVNDGITTGHKVYCTHGPCTCYDLEPHNWIDNGLMMTCGLCGARAKVIPIIHRSLNNTIMDIISTNRVNNGQIVYKYDEHIGIMFKDGSYYIIAEIDSSNNLIEEIPESLFN